MKLKIAFLLVLVSIGLHAYLTFHHYDLNYGAPSGDSVCNINATFNCDAVAVSQYSSLFGIPIALWGAVTNGILAILMLGWMIGWADNLSRLSRYALWLSGLIAGASVVMGGVSLAFMSAYCLFCIATYLLSFATFVLIWIESDDFDARISEDAGALFGESKFYLGLLVAIPIIVFFFHLSATKRPQTEAIMRQSKLFTQQWQVANLFTFDQPPVLTSGSPNSGAKMIITEFADFRCHHCRDAAPSLKTFTKTRAHVELHFFPFPLEKIPEKAADAKTCISCNLSKSVMCANEQAEKGWAMHDALFAAQEEIMTMSSEKVDAKVSELAGTVGINAETLKTCMESDATHTRLLSISAMAQKAGVTSTPTVFVNGKKLSAGQLIPVLESVHRTIK